MIIISSLLMLLGLLLLWSFAFTLSALYVIICFYLYIVFNISLVNQIQFSYCISGFFLNQFFIFLWRFLFYNIILFLEYLILDLILIDILISRFYNHFYYLSLLMKNFIWVYWWINNIILMLKVVIRVLPFIYKLDLLKLFLVFIFVLL